MIRTAMELRRTLSGAGLSLLVLAGWSAVELAARRRDNEADLLARLQREQNPVKKAKYEVRLGRLKLHQAIRSFDQSDLEPCMTLLSAYMGRMQSAWELLRQSGRDASRKPEGFRELEIALREDSLTLRDFVHRVPYDHRAPAEKIAADVADLRAQVIKALFPPQPPRRTRKALLCVPPTVRASREVGA